MVPVYLSAIFLTMAVCIQSKKDVVLLGFKIQIIKLGYRYRNDTGISNLSIFGVAEPVERQLFARAAAQVFWPGSGSGYLL
jgi:hypothetical protein